MLWHRRPINLLVISVFWILVSAGLSYSAEIDEIREAIQINRARWVAEENPISVLPQEERVKRLGAIQPIEGLDASAVPYESFFTSSYTSSLLAATFDWRNNGGNYVTPVRDQGSCGSCWAFAATAALESKALITLNRPGVDLDLSEQIVVSCAGAGSCSGGSPSDASSFFVITGTNLESCYPYTATDGNCNSACSNWENSTYKIDGWIPVSGGSAPTAATLKNAIYASGPLITTFDVYTDFFSYNSGVYSYVSGKYEGGHAVLIVGWNDSDGAFIVKNSWGPGWGESGYFRIAYGELTGKTNFGRYSIAYGNALASAGTGTVAPTPNPMSWATAPYQIGTNSIGMVATTATDPSLPINYYFNFVGSLTGGAGGSDSGWLSGSSYTNSGLQANHQYGYRVKARNGVNNETRFSPSIQSYTAVETPTGLIFGTLTSHSIQVQSSNTPSGLSRGHSGLVIENTTKSTNSRWKRNNDFWTSSYLSPNTSYSFRAKAKNGDGVETAYSPSVSKFTLPNQPHFAAYTNVTQACIRAHWTTSSNPSGTQYWCENTTTGSNSGWTTNTYWDSCSLSCSSSYGFRVKARNGDGVETVWTSLGNHSTLRCPPPSSPTNVSASDGTYSDRVEVTWTASPSATSYKVYRSTSSLAGAIKTALGTTTGTLFSDTTAVPKKTYYYWVRASSAYGTSGFSTSDAGSRP